MNNRINIYTISLLCCIILLQCIYTTSVFNKKAVFHGDELWTYGLSNSYKKAFVIQGSQAYYQNKYTHGSEENWNKWHDGSFFRDYIVVNSNQRFAYDSVVYNQQHDMHPPLYYALLHTICSFFPETFSWYYAFVPQLVFLCITQVFLYLLAYELTRRRKLSLFICFVYACSTIALFTFTFIRQYSMLTMWSVMYTYYLAKMINGKMCIRNAIPVMIFMFLGAMTQYYMLVYAGFMTLLVCIYLMMKKRAVDAINFGLLMCITVEIYTVCWPAAFVNATQQNVADEVYPFPVRLKFLYELANLYSFGIPQYGTIASSYMPIFVGIGLAAAFILPLVFLFRNEAWFLKFINHLKTLFGNIKSNINQINVLVWIIVLVYISSLLFISLKSPATKAGVYSIRYVSFIIPSIIASVIIIVYFILSEITKKYSKYVICTIAIISCVTMTFFQSKDFILHTYEGPSREEIKNELAGQTVAAFFKSPGAAQYMPEYLMNTERVYTGNIAQRDKIIDESEVIDKTDTLYMLICAKGVGYKFEKDEIAKTNILINDNMTYEEMEMMGVQFIDSYEDIGKKLGFSKCERFVKMKNNGFDTVILKLSR